MAAAGFRTAAQFCVVVHAGAVLMLHKQLGEESGGGGETRRYEQEDGAEVQIGVMSKTGVTRYSAERIRKVSSKDGFYMGDPGAADGSRYVGATDLTDNVSWGWHHPNGVYNSIPVGAPLIDDEMSIYLGSDDAVRKFTVNGDLVWTYAPRGALAAAPTLVTPSDRRTQEKSALLIGTAQEAEAEDELRPQRPAGMDSQTGDALSLFSHVRVGDRLRVRAGMGYHADGKEYYKSGDEGEIMKIVTDTQGSDKAVVRWARTRQSSVAPIASLHKRFVRITEGLARTVGMLVGSTSSGYVFALDMATGEEIWATKASDEIQGVKGAVSGRNGVVVAATNRCKDRYCYRYRNQTNPLTPSNTVVRGLSASDGSALWEFKPTSPVWNMVPMYSNDSTTVMFSDFEGSAYCLDLLTGELKWQHQGAMGTYTQSFAVYFGPGNLLYTMGLKNEGSWSYEHKYCNPFPAPGILPWCGTWAGSSGWFRALNASSGRVRWEYDLEEPPASAGFGEMHREGRGTRLVITMGHNCRYRSPSKILSLDPVNGGFLWARDGPTLWTDQCAGDKEGADIRRAMGGRAACEPSSWSAPAIDMYGDLYVGSQVGELQRWGTHDGSHGNRKIQVLSTLTTGVAFQDLAITFAPGMMAVSTCTSLIVFSTVDGAPSMSEDVTVLPERKHAEPFEY